MRAMSTTATMFCESDQARLCWDCDGKVHATNFLVAKHSRTLLCHVCQSHTPWKAVGPKLGPTISACHDCARRPENRGENADGIRSGEESYGSQECEYDEKEDYSDIDGDDDFSEEEGDNQVVPWSQRSLAASSSSTSFSSSKTPKEEDFESEDEEVCCSSDNSDCQLRVLKMPRCSIPPAASDRVPAKSSTGTLAIVERLRRFQQQRRGEEDSDRIATGESFVNSVMNNTKSSNSFNQSLIHSLHGDWKLSR